MLESRFLNLCYAPSQRNNQIKLTYYDETKKMAMTHRVRAKENLNLSHGVYVTVCDKMVIDTYFVLKYSCTVSHSRGMRGTLIIKTPAK